MWVHHCNFVLLLSRHFMLLGDKRLTIKECQLDGEIASGFLESI